MTEIKDIEFFVYKAIMINFEKIKQSHTQLMFLCIEGGMKII